MELLEIHTTTTSHIKDVIVKQSGKRIGHFIRDVDGFFYFYNSSASGAWAPNSLREIADKLDQANKLLNDDIVKYFNAHDDIPEIDLVH